MPASTSISITAWMMQPGDDKIVADRLSRACFPRSAARNPHATAAPAANLSGRWDVNVEFFSSKSQHTLYPRAGRQPDSRLAQGRFFDARRVRHDRRGSDQAAQPDAAQPGDSVGFIFAGTLSGDTISGPIYMGEYLNAKFTAKRHSYPSGRGRIVVPGGPPLAT